MGESNEAKKTALAQASEDVTLPPKNTPLAECFNASKENGNDEGDKGAVHAGVQAGSGQIGRGWTEHRGGTPKLRRLP